MMNSTPYIEHQLKATRMSGKRALDLVVSAGLLLGLSPLLLFIALLVRLSSPGPVFYKATRVGRDGKLFKLYKFRSMVADADKVGPAITTSGDSRITPIGRRLRDSKLDELPQLFNVLKGEMSLVGPRPEDPRYVKLYTPDQRRILSVPPGITSPGSIRYRHEEAQLAGPDWETKYVNEVLPAKLALDLDYVANPSLYRDLVILWQTARAVLQ